MREEETSRPGSGHPSGLRSVFRSPVVVGAILAAAVGAIPATISIFAPQSKSVDLSVIATKEDIQRVESAIGEFKDLLAQRPEALEAAKDTNDAALDQIGAIAQKLEKKLTKWEEDSPEASEDTSAPREDMRAYLASVSSEFEEYRIIDEVALVYKLRLSVRFPPTSYETYLEVFRMAGIHERTMPADVAILEQWDRDMVRVALNALAALPPARTADAAIEKELTSFGRYRSTQHGDTTSYGAWRVDTDTCGGFADYMSNVLEHFRTQLVLNGRDEFTW